MSLDLGRGPLPWLRVYDKLVYYSLLQCVKGLIFLVDSILDVFGFSTFSWGSAAERLEALKEGRSAQVAEIWVFVDYSGFNRQDLSCFLLRHVKYVRPEYVLENDHVKPWDVDGEKAFFLETDEDNDLYNVRKYPLIAIYTNVLAKNVVIVSLQQFHQLADECGDPAGRLSIMVSSGRARSTLICQLMAKVPEVRVISEPWIMVRLHEHYMRSEYSMAEYKRQIGSALRLTCKPHPSTSFKHHFIKLVPHNTAQMEIIHSTFPKAKLLFNTRHLKPMLKSFGKVLRKLVVTKPSWSERIFRFGIDQINDLANVPYSDTERRQAWKEVVNTLSVHDAPEVQMALSLGGSLQCYMTTQSLYSMLVLFEDLESDAERTVRSMLKVMGESEEHTAAALEALKEDSQNGILGHRGEEKNFVTPNHVWHRVDDILNTLNIPFNTQQSQTEFLNIIRGSNTASN